jgi:DNA-binding MarR family transcriptional regulator
MIAHSLNVEFRKRDEQEDGADSEQQVMIILRYFASGSFMQVIGDTLGYDKSTVSRVVEDGNTLGFLFCTGGSIKRTCLTAILNL